MKSVKIKKVSSILNGFLKLILDIMKKKELEKPWYRCLYKMLSYHFRLFSYCYRGRNLQKIKLQPIYQRHQE